MSDDLTERFVCAAGCFEPCSTGCRPFVDGALEAVVVADLDGLKPAETSPPVPVALEAFWPRSLCPAARRLRPSLSVRVEIEETARMSGRLF